MPEPTFADRDIERRVMERLRVSVLHPNDRPIAGFYHPDDQRVIRALEKTGRLTCWMGDGRDRGLLLAQLAAVSPVRVSAGDTA